MKTIKNKTAYKIFSALTLFALFATSVGSITTLLLGTTENAYADTMPIIAPLNMLSESNFVILSQTGITDTGSHSSALKGNIGSSAITSAAIGVFCSEINGKIYGVDAAYVGSSDVIVEVAVPTNSINGSYTTDFGVMSAN